MPSVSWFRSGVAGEDRRHGTPGSRQNMAAASPPRGTAVLSLAGHQPRTPDGAGLGTERHLGGLQDPCRTKPRFGIKLATRSAGGRCPGISRIGVWGGVGVDLRCALCGQLPTRDHFDLEMQFTRDGDRHLGPRMEGRLAQLHDAD